MESKVNNAGVLRNLVVNVKEEDQCWDAQTTEGAQQAKLTLELVPKMEVKREAISKLNGVTEASLSQSPRLTSEAVSQDGSGSCTSLAPSDLGGHCQTAKAVLDVKTDTGNNANKSSIRQNSCPFGSQLILHKISDVDKILQSCELSGKNSSSKAKLLQHSDTGSCKPETCEKSFESKKHSPTSYKCDTCNKTFKWKRSFDMHLQLHTGTQLYKCATCDKNFSSEYYLLNHSIVHSHATPYKCDRCEKCFKTKKYLDNHVQRHIGPYKCNICDKAFSCKLSLLRHSLCHSDTRPYKCDKCEKSFKRKDDLLGHGRCHSATLLFNCDRCEKSYKWKHDLERHLQYHSQTHWCKCDVCQKCFYNSDQLRRHFRMKHSDAKPAYLCDICGASFKTKVTLNIHSVTHSSVKPYLCDHCGKSFRRKGNLAQHTIRHSDKKSHLCDLCGKSFKWKSNLKQHRLTHSSEGKKQ